MNNSKTLQIANIIGLIIVLTVNALASLLPIGGLTTGEVSELYTNLFVPAGYAFSIWAVIYSLLIVFTILQARGFFNSSQEAPAYVETIGWWFVISCIANSTWIFTWHYLLVPLSVVWMLLILLALIMVYTRLNDGSTESPAIVRIAFSIYLGWITVATVANISAALVSVNWNGFGISEITWTIIALSTGTLIGLTMIWSRQDIAYIAVLIWAFIAIAVQRQALAVPEEAIIITVIYIALGLLILTLLGRLFLFKPAT